MKTVVYAAIIVLCLAAGIYIFYQDAAHKELDRQELKKKLASYFYCEACGNEFFAEGGVASTRCPECGKETCENCEHEFVAYEHDIKTNQQRYPGGEWHMSVDIDVPCPECGSRKLISVPE